MKIWHEVVLAVLIVLLALFMMSAARSDEVSDWLNKKVKQGQLTQAQANSAKKHRKLVLKAIEAKKKKPKKGDK